MIGLDASREVGIEGTTQHARCVPVDPRRASCANPSEHLSITADHAREVHDLSDTECPVVIDQRRDIIVVEEGPRRLEW